jgi:hypothetical protein
MLGIEKEEALRRFTAGVKAALTKINFLKNHDMTTLQALVLYLVSNRKSPVVRYQACFLTWLNNSSASKGDTTATQLGSLAES